MARISGVPDKCGVDEELREAAEATANGLADDPRAFIERLAASVQRKAAALSLEDEDEENDGTQ